MSDCVLYVPIDGYLELFMDGSTGAEILGRHDFHARASINLTRNEERVATMLYDYDATSLNPRAITLTHILSGSYVQATGPVVFEGMTEHRALSAMLEVTGAALTDIRRDL